MAEQTEKLSSTFREDFAKALKTVREDPTEYRELKPAKYEGVHIGLYRDAENILVHVHILDAEYYKDKQKEIYKTDKMANQSSELQSLSVELLFIIDKVFDSNLSDNAFFEERETEHRDTIYSLIINAQ